MRLKIILLRVYIDAYMLQCMTLNFALLSGLRLLVFCVEVPLQSYRGKGVEHSGLSYLG